MKILAWIAAAAVLVVIAASAAPAAEEQRPIFPAPVPDCGVMLCVVPAPILSKWLEDYAHVREENARLRDALSEALKSKKCAKLEVTS